MTSLSWRPFAVNLSKAAACIKPILGEKYDGLVARPDRLDVMSLSDLTEAEISTLTAWWNNTSAADFAPTMTEIISGKILSAQDVGQAIVFQAKVGNVGLGVTQANKTKEVSDFLRDLATYLNEGSLTVVPAEVDRIIAGGIPEDITTFVTVERLTAVKHQVQDYLGIPRT